ncbi:L-aspartate oxidase [Tenuibacillus multivorans]|uniref:L-aspartate oxidase n=1 Tax=Tenuibacillus multivorans TaxID=237069 RepID=A0A1G9Z4M4_9BACI|nr:L-aspartate oxidase [Tenuibacillus multivorans]GEL77405.1 L-aspartate oxidase [Tenuibacillus multivorans]SDN16310.1 L-aspartate oxidase [Tenuibacillus multivorans]
MIDSDVIIIGSGLAALQLASKLKPELSVTVLTKHSIKTSNSNQAQGGIAAVIDANDHTDLHTEDTLKAGRYFNNPKVVQNMTNMAPSIIEELNQQGCAFDLDENGHIALGQEGAHSHRRIIHAGGDQTGRFVVDTLINQLSSNIQIVENAFVYEMLTTDNTCYGVKFKDFCEKNHILYGKHIVLATGGCGQIFRLTSNGEGMTGDGVMLAYLAGAEVSDLEFIQFHPTLLYVNNQSRGLISEAVRGEGATLVTESRKRIMEDVHPLNDLAPRHIVAQTIYQYLNRGQSVYLDIAMIDQFKQRFPTIAMLCERHGINLNDGLIPVAPGAHFMMGGITASIDGSTSVKGLYAIGEVTNTGFHGANRLASNSLLEGLVMGKLLAQKLNHDKSEDENLSIVSEKNATSSDSMNLPSLDELRTSMMNYVGIVRDEKQLLSQLNWFYQLHVERYLNDDLGQFNRKEIERILTYNLSLLITKSALARKESRGAHHRADYAFEHEDYLSQHFTYQYNQERRANDEPITT